MKALELVVYPKLDRPWPGEDGFWDWRKQFLRERQAIAGKRFTNAELAAEFWHARYAWANGLYANLYATEVDSDARAYTFKQITRMTVETAILERFATLPHYDEATP